MRLFNIHSVAKHEKIEKKNYFRKKISQCRKKLKGGTLWDFPTSILSQNSKQIGRGDPLVSPGMVWYAGKQEKPFWFSSLYQIVQFDAIILYRTFKNYFGQFVWIEKKESHYNSRVSLHEAPTKNYTTQLQQKKISKAEDRWTEASLHAIEKELSNMFLVGAFINTEAKRCFATHDEEIDYFKDSSTLYIY